MVTTAQSQWARAKAAALKRLEQGALSAAEEVERLQLSDGADVVVYVRVIRQRFVAPAEAKEA